MKDIKLRILNDRRVNKQDPVSLTGDMSGRDIVFKSDLGIFTLVHRHEVPPNSFAQILTLRYYDISGIDYYTFYHQGLPFKHPESIHIIFYFQNSFSENSISCWLNPSILNKSLLIKSSKPEYNIFPGDPNIYNYKLDLTFGINADNSIQLGKIDSGDLIYIGLPDLCNEPIRCDIVLLSSDPDVYNTIKYNDYYSPQIGLGYTGGTGATGGSGGTGGPFIFPPGSTGNGGFITPIPNSKLHYVNRTGGTGGVGGYGFLSE